MKLTLKEIRAIIQEVADVPDESLNPADTVDTPVENFKTSSDSDMDTIGRMIGSTARSLRDEVEKEGASEELKGFFTSFVNDASDAATSFSENLEGQLSSALAAKEFFEENIHRFPSASREHALHVIDLVEAYQAHTSDFNV